MINFSMWAHQKEAVERASTRDNFALFFEVGAGKSLTALQILRAKYIQEGFILRTIIFAPPIVLPNWVSEIDKFTKIKPENVEIIYGAGKKRAERIQNSPCPILITNYETLQMKECHEALLNWKPTCIVFDESHRLKNIQSKRTKAAITLADTAKYKYLLSGSPILNSLMDLFSQYRIMDGGATFGKNFFVFRHKYFTDKNEMKRRVNPRIFPEWAPKESSFQLIQEAIKESSMYVRKQDCMDLPDFVNVQINVELSPEQKRVYKAIEKDWIATFSDTEAVAFSDLAITKAIRLQQVVTGFVNLDDGEVKHFDNNPRAQALKSILEDVVIEGGSKVIIWAVFKENYETIRRVLKELDLEYGEIHGEVTSKERQESVARFKTSPDCKVIFGHPASGGIGINLVESDTTIFFSRTFSLEHSIQAEARNYRGGSEIHKKVTRIDLVSSGTIDEDVTQALLDKNNISKGVLKSFIVKRAKEK